MTPRQLDILQHALGLNQYGQGRYGEDNPHRNWFAAGAEDEPDCRDLVSQGLMKEHYRTEVYPYYNCSVTDAGRVAVKEQSPKPPKLTPSQRRYREYLHEDSGMKFAEWLKARQKRQTVCLSSLSDI